MTKFYTFIANDQPSRKPAGYDVTNCVRSAANWIGILAMIAKIVHRVVSDNQVSSQMVKLFYFILKTPSRRRINKKKLQLSCHLGKLFFLNTIEMFVA